MRPVLTKQDFTVRYATGEFGNHSPTYNTPHDMAVNVNPNTLVHLRNRVAGGKTYYSITAADAWDLWTEMSIHQQDMWYVSLMAPTHHTLIQGEVMEGPWGLNLTWTTIKKPMREALKCLSNFNTGLLAKHLLQKAMNDLSWQWLQYLLETYQDHVVEFSVYSECWGTIPGYNTVFWEIRRGY